MQLRDYLFQKIEKDQKFNPIYVNNDYSSPFLDKIKASDPQRVLNVGIAEQAMVSIAAGIKKSGHDSLCYSISTFLYSRANEQIKINFLSQKIPFFFISMGPGFDYPEDGPSHHCIEENSITFNYPNTEIFNPLTEKCIDKHYPNYEKINNKNIIFSILRKRLSQNEEEILGNKFISFEGGYFSKNDDPNTTIICNGYTAFILLKNYEELNRKKVNMIILTDLKSSLPKILKTTQKYIIWSESLINSGFHSYHYQKLQNTTNTRILQIGVDSEELYPFYGNREMQSSRYKYDFENLLKNI